MIIKEAIQESTQRATEAGWDENWNDYEKIALVHSELSEAVEELRNGHKPTEIYFSNMESFDTMKPEGFPIELADTMIRIFHICGHHGIDLEKAIQLKTLYNKTRSYRHGGKNA